MGKTKDLSKDCKNIVLNLFKFFQLDHLLLTSDHIKASYYRRIFCTYNQDLIKLK
jgi:hypothetical protein